MVSQNELALKIFDGLSSSYDSVVTAMTLHQDGAWKRKMLDGLHLRRGDRILDVGCGTGVLEEDHHFEGCQVIGVDITNAMIVLAKGKRLAPVSTLGLADAEHLPFREDSFDHVVSCYVPKYCDTARLVEEFSRVLKPGGTMAVYDFTRPRGLLSPLLNLYESGLMPLFGRLAAPFDQSLAFTLRALPGLIKKTAWDEELEEAIKENGLVELGSEAATFGVVTIFWARKR